MRGEERIGGGEEEKQEAIIEAKEEHQVSGKCLHNEDGVYCDKEAFSHSPGGFCEKHLLADPTLKELGFNKPGRMTVTERKEYTEKAIRFLKRTVPRRKIQERS